MPSHLMSLRGYARHRGVTLRSVQKAIESGRIKRTPGGKINSTVADVSWELSSDHSKKREPIAAVDTLGARYAKARASSEEYKARSAKLHFEKDLGKLVDADVVKRRAFDQGRALRESLMGLSHQLATELAAESDPAKITVLLEREMAKCLEELAGAAIADAEAGRVHIDIAEEEEEEFDG